MSDQIEFSEVALAKAEKLGYEISVNSNVGNV